jgi:phosphate acetyltransferase
MRNILKRLRTQAQANPKKIVFPEAGDDRILEAIDYIKKEKIAYPLLLTPDNLEPEKQEEFASIFYERKQLKGISFEEAREIIENPVYYSAMMVRLGYADGFVAGARYTTSDVIRAAINCLSLDRASRIISSCFIMAIPNCDYGEGIFVYADCGVIPYPTSEQLALIAVSAARFAKDVLNIVPRVALLSFSTKGSAEGRWIDKVRKAVAIARERDPNILIDGELQPDSAIVPEVARRKVSYSNVAGQANVLIFPNLDAGNICYKLTERLAKARAVGPIVLGTKEPCTDLSRGCSVEDIIDGTAVTVVRAQNREK